MIHSLSGSLDSPAGRAPHAAIAKLQIRAPARPAGPASLEDLLEGIDVKVAPMRAVVLALFLVVALEASRLAKDAAPPALRRAVLVLDAVTRAVEQVDRLRPEHRHIESRDQHTVHGLVREHTLLLDERARLFAREPSLGQQAALDAEALGAVHVAPVRLVVVRGLDEALAERARVALRGARVPQQRADEVARVRVVACHPVSDRTGSRACAVCRSLFLSKML
mmetsp:Transcript_2716/g.6912  ORF Transcript_2716/g.6912 Transcript_2716/m.6912 type:complete len:223 (+) Transcript_2716:107-775(+)